MEINNKHLQNCTLCKKYTAGLNNRKARLMRSRIDEFLSKSVYFVKMVSIIY